MKKFFICILSIFILLCNFNIFVFADTNLSITASYTEVKQGETAKIDIILSNNNTGFSSLVITPSCNDAGITFSDSAKGDIRDLIINHGNSIVFSSSSDITANGTLCTLSFKVADIVKPGDYDVIITVNECSKSDTSPVAVSTVKGKITVECKKHDYKYFTHLDDEMHTAKCSVCYKTETVAHNWNKEEVIEEATCKTEGEKILTCGECDAMIKANIPKTDAHKYGDWSLITEPDCTNTGSQERECSVCSYIEQGAIAALGHDFGDFKETKKATCTEDGEQKHVCKRCDFEESEEIKAKGHEFGKLKTTKKATISKEGLKEAKCKNCDEVTKEVIPCSETDKDTNTLYEAELGVFKNGTTMNTELITKGSIKERAETALITVSDTFFIYNISAVYKKDTVKPDGVINITFDIPSGFGTEVAIYYITDVGVAEKLDSTISEDGKTIKIITDKLGTFTVCKLGSVPINNSTSNTRERGNFKVFFAALFVIIILSIVVAFFALKKKVYNNPDIENNGIIDSIE